VHGLLRNNLLQNQMNTKSIANTYISLVTTGKSDTTIAEEIELAEGVIAKHSAAALAATAHANNNPSNLTHTLAATARDVVVAAHERKINALLKGSGEHSAIADHETQIALHKRHATAHRFVAWRLKKRSTNS